MPVPPVLRRAIPLRVETVQIDRLRIDPAGALVELLLEVGEGSLHALFIVAQLGSWRVVDRRRPWRVAVQVLLDRQDDHRIRAAMVTKGVFVKLLVQLDWQSQVKRFLGHTRMVQHGQMVTPTGSESIGPPWGHAGPQ